MPRAIETAKQMSFEAYLEFEKTSEVRHEFVNDFTTDIKATFCFILEVLSDSTQDVDRDEKWHNYRAMASLQTYVLASQKKKFLEIYQKQNDGTWLYNVLEDEGLLFVPCITLNISLEDIYENMNFTGQES